MVKSELVQRIAAQNPHLFTRDVEKAVNAILDRSRVCHGSWRPSRAAGFWRIHRLRFGVLAQAATRERELSCTCPRRSCPRSRRGRNCATVST